MLKIYKISMFAFIIICSSAFAEDPDSSKGYIIEDITQVPTTSVKNQAGTGTCWSFSFCSFVETELMRMGKDSIDISEMYFVRQVYPEKAVKYVRYHGIANIGPGSLFGDGLRTVKNHGYVPENVYSGMQKGDIRHDHTELDAVLNASLDAIIKNRSRQISKAWSKLTDAILDIYLGPEPKNFKVNGKSFTPKTYAEHMGFNPDNYIDVSSYNHHPFYKKFALEIPDNWANNLYQNVPLDEFIEILIHALENGYSVGFDGDVSEKSFSQKHGVAILPEKHLKLKSKDEQSDICKSPEPEKIVDQQIRQESFDNYTSKDDHLMHIIGIAKDEDGTVFYKTKNSWGTLNSKYNGYIYMSESFVRSKAMSILVPKEAIPEHIRDKFED